MEQPVTVIYGCNETQMECPMCSKMKAFGTLLSNHFQNVHGYNKKDAQEARRLVREYRDLMNEENLECFNHEKSQALDNTINGLKALKEKYEKILPIVNVKPVKKKKAVKPVYTIPNNFDCEKTLESLDFYEDIDGLEFMLKQCSLDDKKPAKTPSKEAKTSKEDKPKKKRNQPELAVQRKLEKQTGGKHQAVPDGVIDILSSTELIEIKHWDNFKHGVGQLLHYSQFYPMHMLRLHLFGPKPPEEKCVYIYVTCAKTHIRLTYEK